MKYIDADKLKKSISNYIEGARAALNPTDGDADYYKGKIDACKDIQEFIDSLQQKQPEVDLNKETIIDYVHNHYHYDKDFDGYGHSNLRPVFTREDLTELARHFYSLGINARKEG